MRYTRLQSESPREARNLKMQTKNESEESYTRRRIDESPLNLFLFKKFNVGESKSENILANSELRKPTHHFNSQSSE